MDRGCVTAESETNPNYNPTSDSGSRQPTDTGSGSRQPTDTDSGSRQPTDTDSGSRQPTDSDSGSRQPTDTDSGSRQPTDTDSGSRQPTDTDSGSRQPTDTDSGSRQPTDTGSGSRQPTDTDSGSRQPTDSDSGSRQPTDQDQEPDSGTMPKGNPKKADYTYSVTSDQITMTMPDGSSSSIDIRGFTNVQLDPSRQLLYYLYNGYLYRKNWSGDVTTTQRLVRLGSRIRDLIYLPSSGRIYFVDISDQRRPSLIEYDPSSGSRRDLAPGRSPAPGTISVREDGTIMWMEPDFGFFKLIQQNLRTLAQQSVDLPATFTGKESNISYLNTGSGGFIYFLRDGQFMRYNMETRRVEVVESGPVRFISRALPRLGGVFYITSSNKVVLPLSLLFVTYPTFKYSRISNVNIHATAPFSAMYSKTFYLFYRSTST